MSGFPAPGRRRLDYYRAHFLESVRRDGVVCLECGRLRKTLGIHMLFLHQMTLDDYREKWGFNRGTRFLAASTAAKLRRLAIKRNLGAKGSAELLAKARAARGRGSMARRAQTRITLSESAKRRYAAGWKPRRFRKVDDRTLRRLAREGLALKRIARKAKLSVDQTRKRLQALGLLPPHRPRRTVNRERILALRRKGLWPLEIARRMGIKPQLVRKILWILRNQGVKIPRPSRPRPIKKRRVADAAFLAAYRRGGAPAQIAARLRVSRAYVIFKTYYLRKRGKIAPLRRRAQPPDTRARVVRAPR